MIRRRVRQTLAVLTDRGVKTLILSCHTLAACVRDAITRWTDLPVIDIISPAAAAACRATRKGRIGILGPETLIDSGVYPSEVAAVGQSAVVIGRPAPLLESLVETGRLKQPETVMIVKKYVRPLAQNGVDTLIPGCGHYTPLYPVIRRKAGKRVHLIDPVAELVEAAEKAIGRMPVAGEGGGRFLFSDTPPWLEAAARRLFGANLYVEAAPLSAQMP